MGPADAAIALFADFDSPGTAAMERPAAGRGPGKIEVGGGAVPRGLSAAGSVLDFVRNREIYGEGCEADLFFRVLTGVVRTCKLLSDGRRQVDAFHVAGDVFGLELGARHGLSAEAVCDSTIISYRRREIATHAANSKRLSHQLFSYAMHSLARAQAHSLLLGRGTAIEKVAAFLTDWSAHSSQGEVVTLVMPRQDIADYLGLTTETVSRILSQLERRGLIERPTARQVRLKNRRTLRDLNS